MAERILPEGLEDFRFGMDDHNSPKKLSPHVYQGITNAYPGTTLKPLNGLSDVVVKNSFLTNITSDLDETQVDSIVEFLPHELLASIYVSCERYVYKRQTDGTWDVVLTLATTNEITLIVFNDTLIALGTNDNNVHTSVDGTTWLSNAGGGTGGIHSALVFDGNLYIGCGNSIRYSGTGTSGWNLGLASASDSVLSLTEFSTNIYAVTANGQLWKGGGNSWTLFGTIAGTTTSSDGVSFGSYLYILFAGDVYQSDGVAWGSSPRPMFFDAYSLTVGSGGNWLYVGTDNGDIYRSSDGLIYVVVEDGLDNNNMVVEAISTSIYIGTKSTGQVYILHFRHVLFRPHSEYITKNNKEYLFQWSRDVDDTNKFTLEIWNLTDSVREQLIYGTWSSTNVYYSMVKLYDAIYLTMNYEMSNNPDDSYQTKNKIIEWDEDTLAWVVREAGIDVAGQFGELDVTNSAENVWSIRESHEVVEFLGKLWLLGGRYNSIAERDYYSSVDGVAWTMEANPPSGGWGGALVVFKNKMWRIGGILMPGGTSGGDNIYSTVDGITWETETLSAAYGDIANFKVVVFAGKMWLTGGQDATINNDVWCTDDGVTWVSVKTSPAFGQRSYHSMLSYDNKMWVIAGEDIGTGNQLNDVYSSIDGITWTLETASPTFSPRHSAAMVVYRGKMWLTGGYDFVLGSSVYYNDVYSSTDGITWTEENASADFVGRSGHAMVVFSDFMWILGGRFGSLGTSCLNDKWISETGILWTERFTGLTSGLYRTYASTFIKRGDDTAVLSSLSQYIMQQWETYGGKTVVGNSEKLLTGTVTMGGGNLTGVGTAFLNDLEVGAYIRIDGDNEKVKINTIVSDTVATVIGVTTHTAKEYSLLPSVGDLITTNSYHPGIVEGIENLESRRTLYIVAPSGVSDRARVVIQLPGQSVIDNAVSHGATHLRVYRTLGNDSKIVSMGLSLRYLVDIVISGDVYNENGLYFDGTSEDALEGSLNFLYMTGYSVPPLGRYSIWAGEVWWIGGNPDNPGYWFHSVKRGTAGVQFNTAHPQKFASMFNLGVDYKTIDPADGQNDSGCAVLMGDLYLFKERKIFVVYNSDPKNTPVQVHHSLGCVCPGSITNADIPALGGQCVLFESGDGPAYISQGGKVSLLTRYTIADLWPDKTGILRQSDGAETDWYSRNKVTCAFWDNTWWFFFGDTTDSDTLIPNFRCVGFHFSNDGVGVGAFEKTFANYSSSVIYEPQMLIPISNKRAYTFSHKQNASGEKTYRCTRFLDSTKWLDEYEEGSVASSFGYFTRFLFSGIRAKNTGVVKKVVIYIDFVDTTALTIRVRSDETRLIANSTFVQERQSGVMAPASETYRDTIVFDAKGEDLWGSFFDLLLSKVIPADGNAEINGYELVVVDSHYEPEYSSGLGAATGATTFIVESGTVPEVDAH